MSKSLSQYIVSKVKRNMEASRDENMHWLSRVVRFAPPIVRDDMYFADKRIISELVKQQVDSIEPQQVIVSGEHGHIADRTFHFTLLRTIVGGKHKNFVLYRYNSDFDPFAFALINRPPIAELVARLLAAYASVPHVDFLFYAVSKPTRKNKTSLCAHVLTVQAQHGLLLPNSVILQAGAWINTREFRTNFKPKVDFLATVQRLEIGQLVLENLWVEQIQDVLQWLLPHPSAEKFIHGETRHVKDGNSADFALKFKETVWNFAKIRASLDAEELDANTAHIINRTLASNPRLIDEILDDERTQKPLLLIQSERNDINGMRKELGMHPGEIHEKTVECVLDKSARDSALEVAEIEEHVNDDFMPTKRHNGIFDEVPLQAFEAHFDDFLRPRNADHLALLRRYREEVGVPAIVRRPTKFTNRQPQPQEEAAAENNNIAAIDPPLIPRPN